MHSTRKTIQWCSLLIGYAFISNSYCLQRYNMLKMMDLVSLPAVRGMKKLDRTLFETNIDVPCIEVKSESIKNATQVLKKYFLKLNNFPVIKSSVMGDSKVVHLNPKLVSSFQDIAEQQELSEVGIEECSLRVCAVPLTYDNWSPEDILKAVLPEGAEIATGYSLVGHIVHLNLREHLLDYKSLIGDVFLDKIKQARTVVNKVDNIDSTFRVFNMEVLAGDHDFVTEVKENCSRFKFDFSTVYWNPRLATEHERIVKKLNPGNVLYDVFAGVGPFSIPAAKKKCIVLANDLNPESFKWLKHNAKINKVENSITAFNKDGADFIRHDVKKDILGSGGQVKSHVVMNLPSIAVTFLREFRQLFSPHELSQIKRLPLVHTYCFVKGDSNPKDMAREIVEQELNHSISEAIDEITFVRNVAPNKDMMRVSFQLTENIILGGKRKNELADDEKNKKIK